MIDRYRLTDFFYGYSLDEKREFIRVREQLSRADLEQTANGGPS